MLVGEAIVATKGRGGARTSGESRVAAQHGNARAVLRATEGDHVLADVSSHDLPTLRVGVGEDVLNEVIAELISSNIDEWHARTIRTSLAYTVEVTVQELRAADLEALLNNLRGELVHAVLSGVAEDVVDGAAAVGNGTVLADVLNAPVAELTVSDDVDAGKDLGDARALVFLQAVLEDVLDNETASFTEGNLVPHATKGFVDVLHDLRRGTAPAKLEQLLPDVARVAVDNRLRDATQQLVYHDGLVLFWDAVEGLLDDMAAEGIHREVQGIAANGVRDSDDLIRRAMLKAALNEEVAEAVDHQRVGLVDDGLYDLELLFLSADLELLLEKDRGLLVIVAYNLVDDIAPVAAHVAIEKAAVIERFGGGHVRWNGSTRRLHLPRCIEVGGRGRESRADGRLEALGLSIMRRMVVGYERVDGRCEAGRAVGALPEGGLRTHIRVWRLTMKLLACYGQCASFTGVLTSDPGSRSWAEPG